jgi:metal-responsive CopG/Arc/MetJ family transcriptional regulator
MSEKNERKRDVNLHVKLTPDERRMLDELSERSGLSRSDVIRQAIRGAYAEMEVDNG